MAAATTWITVAKGGEIDPEKGNLILLASLKKLNHKWGFVAKNMLNEKIYGGDSAAVAQRAKQSISAQTAKLMECAIDARNLQAKDAITGLADQKIRKKMHMLYGRRSSSHILHPTYNFMDRDTPPAFYDSDIDGQDDDANGGLTKSFMDYFIIAADNPYKSKFDVFVLLLVGYSCITSLYNAAFTPLNHPGIVVWDWMVEAFFYTDLVLSFFHAYVDEETDEIVEDFASIYKTYLGGWFIVDLVAVFPFQVIFKQGFALKLFRLARLPRMFKLLDVERFKKVLVDISPVKPSIQQLIERDNVMFVYSVFRLTFIILMMTYFFGCVFFLFSKYLNGQDAIEAGNTFITANGLGDERPETESLIVVTYFALTTLSTVGYGDYSPVSDQEMLLTICA